MPDFKAAVLTGVILMMTLMLVSGTALSADQQVISDDGREVLLKEDGTWVFRSDDRFADTADGRRVRLKADGTWEYIGNAALASEQQVRTRELEITLQNVVVEKHEKKVQKNVRVHTQTVFYLELEVSASAAAAVVFSEKDRALIEVNDNKGRNYPVVSVRPGSASLEPDSRLALVIRADGSPQWWKSIKSIALTFRPGIFGLEQPYTLSRAVDDVEKKNVDGFDTE